MPESHTSGSGFLAILSLDVMGLMATSVIDPSPVGIYTATCLMKIWIDWNWMMLMTIFTITQMVCMYIIQSQAALN